MTLHTLLRVQIFPEGLDREIVISPRISQENSRNTSCGDL